MNVAAYYRRSASLFFLLTKKCWHHSTEEHDLVQRDYNMITWLVLCTTTQCCLTSSLRRISWKEKSCLVLRH